MLTSFRNRIYAHIRHVREDRRGFLSFPIVLFTTASFLGIAFEGFYSVTGELAVYQRIGADQFALTITHDASNLIANYDTTSGRVVRQIPTSVQNQLTNAITQELIVMGGTAQASCNMPNPSQVSCAVSYRSAQKYLALGGAVSALIGTTTATRTESIVSFGS
jgi:hypothetical protein